MILFLLGHHPGVKNSKMFLWESLYMWGSQEKILGKKVNVNFFRIKNPKTWKILISAHRCFEKLKQYLGGLAIFLRPLVCEGLWKIAKSHKFGFSFSKQHRVEVFKIQLCITGPVMHLRVVQLSRNFGDKPKIGIYRHLFFYLLSFWPTVTALVTPLSWAVHCVRNGHFIADRCR